MELALLLQGLLMGFLIAAPVGPIGVLCIRRTLAEGRVVGLLSGLGAATADALYGCIVGLGLTAVAALLLDYALLVQLVGGLFLCYLGVATLRSRPAEQAAVVGGRGLLGAYASTFLLTLTNPATIISFVGIFTGLGLVNAGGYSAVLLVGGVFLGSALWWLILSSATGLLRGRMTTDGLVWVNRLSGVAIIAFGLLALLSIWG